MEDKIRDLAYAKEAVLSIIKDSNCLVDMHGLVYWAQRVEELRKLIKELLWRIKKNITWLTRR